MKTYKLYLDDYRDPQMSIKHFPEFTSLYIKNDWVIARSYYEFVEIITERLNKNEWPMFISFDHDLADEHMKYFFDNGGFDKNPDPSLAEFKEKTGMDCAKWLCELIMDNNLPLPGYAVHSANPAGRANIKGYLDNFKDHYEKK